MKSKYLLLQNASEEGPAASTEAGRGGVIPGLIKLQETANCEKGASCEPLGCDPRSYEKAKTLARNMLGDKEKSPKENLLQLAQTLNIQAKFTGFPKVILHMRNDFSAPTYCPVWLCFWSSTL